jgi:hypothetical protein
MKIDLLQAFELLHTIIGIALQMHHLHMILHMFEQCGDAIAEARDLAASTIYADNEHPEWGEYPLLNVEAALVI